MQKRDQQHPSASPQRPGPSLQSRTKEARKLMAAVSVPDELRPCLIAAAASASLLDDAYAFFGGTKKRLLARLQKEGIPESDIVRLEQLGIIVLYSNATAHPRYIFMDNKYPVSFPEEGTRRNRESALRLIESRIGVLPEIDIYIVRYLIACSYAPIKFLECSMDWIRFFIKKYHSDYNACEDALARWWGENLINSVGGKTMFDINYFVGVWED